MRRAFSRFFDNGTHVSSLSICVTLSYIPYLPFTKRAALRCTISNYRSCTFGGCARQWRCILGRTVQGRSKRFPLVFPDSPSGCASRMTTWSLLLNKQFISVFTSEDTDSVPKIPQKKYTNIGRKDISSCGWCYEIVNKSKCK